MSNIIDFLERMGQDAQLRHASQSDLELALEGMQIDSELQAAILAKDPSQLEALLERAPLFCMQFPGKEDEEEGDGEGENDDTEESPSRESEELVLQPLFRNVASVG